MGFRFRRSISILPGLKLNFSKSGISVSGGPKGAKITTGPRGARVTAGLPGTGLSVTQGLSDEHQSLPTRTQNVRKLIEDKPANWEFELLQAALEDQLNEWNDRWQLAKTGRAAEPVFAHWVGAQLAELEALMNPFMRLLTTDLKEALGQPGEAGDADKILRCVNALAEVIDDAIAWEARVSLFALDPRFSEAVNAMSGMSKPYLDVVNELHRQLRDQIPNLGKTGHLDLSLNMGELPNVDVLKAALDKLAPSSKNESQFPE